MPAHWNPEKVRKLPVQARSIATIAALDTAAIQVLTREGLGRCTTTRIAERAGVSVGTIYQYYANRDALLAAVLERHLAHFSAAIIGACHEAEGKPIAEMTRHLAAALVDLKMSNPQEAAALYTVAAEKIGGNIARSVHSAMLPAVETLLRSVPDARFEQPTLTSEVFLSIVLGLPRTVLEGYASPELTDTLDRQIQLVLSAYLRSASHDRV